jgi:thioredoxin 1
MAEITLTVENFEEEVLQSTVPVFVDFWAPWCGPCQMMGPIVEELAHEYDPSVLKVAKLNVDDHGEIAGRYGIMSIPTFILFKGGEVLDQGMGGMPKDRVKAFIDKHLAA